jgi:hypothetical protein
MDGERSEDVKNLKKMYISVLQVMPYLLKRNVQSGRQTFRLPLKELNTNLNKMAEPING